MKLRSGRIVGWGTMKLRSGRIVGNSWTGPDMKGKKKAKALILPVLPEELVEGILATLPFPQIFQMRILSKSWNAKLSSISSQSDNEKKLLAASFQRLVCEQRDKWRIFNPVFLFHEFLITYDGASDRWHKIPTLSFLSDEAIRKVRGYFLTHPRSCISIFGALLSITSLPGDSMYVINIFTGSCKELPALPHVENGRIGTEKRLVSGKVTYKVIRLFTDVGYVCAWIYDSKFCSWSSKRIAVEKDFEVDHFDVYLNGIIYVPLYVQLRVWGFLAFDVKDETFKLLEMPQLALLSEEAWRSSYLVACNDTVYFIRPNYFNNVVLVEADLVERTWSIISLSSMFGCMDYIPWNHYESPFNDKPSSDGDCIFFEQEGTDGKIFTYNMLKQEWSFLAKGEILKRSGDCVNFQDSFQPGMNPFLEV